MSLASAHIPRASSGGRGIRTHGDVTATMVFKSVSVSWLTGRPTCAIGGSGRHAEQAHPAYIPRLGWHSGARHGSSGHKITARPAASWITELSSSARASFTPYSSQDATKVTGPSGGSG